MVNPIRLGGNNKCVQIDETKLNYNVKSHRVGLVLRQLGPLLWLIQVQHLLKDTRK
jgi:hypothetical protein